MTWLALVLIGFVASAPAAQLQPKTYVSSSGGWSLRVEPLTREGTGEADYTLTGGGREAWKKRHSFALWDAAVTDDGRVAGYAYVGAGPDSPWSGSLHVVVLSPKGEVLLDEPHERQSSRFPHSPADPSALGLFLEAESRRFVVRISDEDINRRAEMWWAYDLETGAPLFQVRPKLELDLDPAIRGALAVGAVPKTPLVLVHWYRFQAEKKPWSIGAVFQLLDAERHAVWRLELPHDYEVREDEAAKGQWVLEICEKGGILGTASQRFELCHTAEGTRVTYEIARDADGAWSVGEVARRPYRGEKEGAPTLGEPFRPKLLREVRLGGTALPKPEIRDILTFAFDEQGRLRFARGEENGTTLVQLSESGELRSSTSLNFELRDSEEVVWFPLAPPRWLAVQQTWENYERAQAWFVDENTGGREKIPDFPHQEVRRAAQLADGHFVVLGTSGLTAFRADRTMIWRVGGDTEGAARLLAGDDMTVTSEGKIAVLGRGRDLVQVFSADGLHLDTIKLASVWGQEPNYPSSIVADPHGGVLIHDFHGKPALWHMGLDGSVRAKLDARMRDGQPREEYRRAIRFAPDGRMWTTDGHEFVRLDEQGVADLQLGPPAQLDWLESPGPALIDSTFGRLLILDDRTRALHVFDGEGQRVTSCLPRPSDLAALRFPLEMLCDSAGGVLAAKSQHTKSYVRFATDGASLGTQELGGANAAFVPGRDAYWSVEKSAPTLIGPDGKQELELAKRADGSWWRAIEDLSVAGDGTLTVLDLPPTDGIQRKRGAGIVARFDAAGRSLGEHSLPEGLCPSVLAHAGHWVLLSSYGPPAWLLDTRDGTLRSIEFGEAAESDTSWALGLAPSGEELWMLEVKNRRLLRHSLPD